MYHTSHSIQLEMKFNLLSVYIAVNSQLISHGTITVTVSFPITDKSTEQLAKRE